MLGTKKKAIRIATNLVKSNTSAVEFAERLTRCNHKSYRGLNIFVEDLAEFSIYFVIDGGYKELMTSDTAESAEVAWYAAKVWVRSFHASEN